MLNLKTHGAGEGNRTLAISLEGWSSTTELHPQNIFLVEETGFEPVKAELTDLQSVPFSHLGTPPSFLKVLMELARGLEPPTY